MTTHTHFIILHMSECKELHIENFYVSSTSNINRTRTRKSLISKPGVYQMTPYLPKLLVIQVFGAYRAAIPQVKATRTRRNMPKIFTMSDTVRLQRERERTAAMTLQVCYKNNFSTMNRQFSTTALRLKTPPYQRKAPKMVGTHIPPGNSYSSPELRCLSKSVFHHFSSINAKITSDLT